MRDLLYPPLCSGCGERGSWLCDTCRASIPLLAELPSTCGRCGIPVHRMRCGCGSLHPRVTRAASAFPYAGWVAEAVRGVKFGSERDRAGFLGALLAATPAAELLREADAVVPVPMHAGRERERGYNQAALIAEHACRALGRDTARRVLVQHEERPSQIGLNARERRTNVRGSFSIAADVALPSGLRYAIVDDVRTTGSTLMACVETLRPLRPARIDVVTLAAELHVELLEEILGPEAAGWR